MEIVLSCFLIYYVFNSSGRTSGQRRKNEEEDIQRERSTGFKNIDSGPKEIVFEDVEASYKSVSKVKKSNNGTKLSTVVSSQLNTIWENSDENSHLNLSAKQSDNEQIKNHNSKLISSIMVDKHLSQDLVFNEKSMLLDVKSGQGQMTTMISQDAQ